MTIFRPQTGAQAIDAVQTAFASKTPLAISGNNTKQGLGHQVEATTSLSLSGLSGITLYEPGEMVLTVRAGTTLREVEDLLSRHGQCLAFEPAGLGPLWGQSEDTATIGGTISAGISGSRRFSAGAPRDHLLGFTGINGKGECFRAGGKVVKNVTGYDLPKLAAGSFGTLAVMTELTLRAVPRAPVVAGLAVENLEPAAAFAILRKMSASPLDPTGLAYLPASIAIGLTGKSASLTLIRLEGNAEGVADRMSGLRRALSMDASTLDAATTQNMFRALSGVSTLFSARGNVWRVCVPPTQASVIVSELAPSSFAADWAGGLLWMQMAPSMSPQHVHTVATRLGGHATLFRQQQGEPDGTAIFPPLDAAMFLLNARLKDAFDPARILNPGRMHKGL